jgi:hypothetical protein
MSGSIGRTSERPTVPYVNFLFPKLKFALKGRRLDDITIQEQLQAVLAILKHGTSANAFNSDAFAGPAASICEGIT